MDNIHAQNADTTSIQYHPIGKFHTAYNTKTGAPRQGILLPDTKGSIEIYPEYRSALKDLDLFEYIIVLFHFSEVENWESTVNPPESTHDHNFGLFSTRSPKRPNPIGFSIVKLESLVDGKLIVSGVDAFDGTPILDYTNHAVNVVIIKCIPNELIEEELGHHDEDFISDSTFYK